MSTYSELRKQELKHIEQSMKDDRKLKRAMAGVYRNSVEDIQRHIDADIMRFAAKENVSMVEAKRIISKTDVEAFQSKAKRYVEEKNFSPKANKELRRYNVTMRTSRLELLQARINLDTTALALEEERLTGEYIAEEVIKERIRQAGILGMSVPSQSQLNTLARSVVLSDVSGSTFSDRIWANQNELRERINTTIERALIRGEHPRKSAASIKRLVRDEYGKSKRAADRILITEVARSQTIAGVEAFKAAEVDKMMWIAEPDACPICSDMDGKVFNIDTSGLTIPAHPFCRCSYAGYIDDESEIEQPIEDTENVEEVSVPDYDFKEADIETLNEQAIDWRDEMTYREELVIEAFTKYNSDDVEGYSDVDDLPAFSFRSLNETLYSGEKLSNDDEVITSILDSALDKFELTEHTKLYRGMSAEEFESLRKRSDEGLPVLEYKSTSANKSTADFFGREMSEGYSVEFDVPKGNYGGYMGLFSESETEQEFILKRDLRIHLKEFDEEKGTAVFQVLDD